MRRSQPCPHTHLIPLLLALVVSTSACESVPSVATPLAAVKLVRREEQSEQIPVGKIGTVTAACQSGEQLLSGGYYVDAFEGAATVVASYPSASEAWTVTDDNAHGPSHVTIVAYASCLQAPYSVGLRIVPHASQSSAATFQATTADCPPGAVITGGGFHGGVSSSMPTSSGWTSAISGPGNVFALCATKRLRAAPAASATFTTQTVFGPPQGASAHCPAEQIVTGGGYTFAQGETSIAVNALAPDASSWGIGAAGGYQRVSVVVWAACVIAPRS